MAMLPPECYDCRHFRPPPPDPDREVLPEDAEVVPFATCTAFPEGIPVAIFFGVQEDPNLSTTLRTLHREPYPGDHGIQFAPADRAAA
jgi:hypothetical protein